MSIHALIDRTCRCTICDASIMERCRCWLKFTCDHPGCTNETSVARSEFEAEIGFEVPDSITATCPQHQVDP